MSGFFEKILYDQSGSVNIGRNPEKIREKENLEGILEKISANLDDPVNEKNIDQVTGDNSCAELKEDIKMTKDILEKTGLLTNGHSNGKEILRNIETSFTAFLRKAREKNLERYADVIREDYEKLNSFFKLALNCEEFRKKEFGSESGFLTEHENASGGAGFRLDIDNYLKKCEEKFKQRNN